MKNILLEIVQANKTGTKLLAILIDPDKIDIKNIENIENTLKKINNSPATHIFVGGSTVQNSILDDLILSIKTQSKLPIVLFPGHPSQISKHADGILFLNLISGRNPDYLIDFQVQSVPKLLETNLEIMPTAYLLIDGGIVSAVQKVSKTEPLLQDNPKLICQTAVAGEFMGNHLIYLEAGSGAKTVVSHQIINLVSKNTTCPLIVGGGITSKSDIDAAYQNGATIVVIGTAFENDDCFFDQFY